MHALIIRVKTCLPRDSTFALGAAFLDLGKLGNRREGSAVSRPLENFRSRDRSRMLCKNWGMSRGSSFALGAAFLDLGKLGNRREG